MDFVREVTAPQAYQWDPEDTAVARLDHRQGQNGEPGVEIDPNGEVFRKLPPVSLPDRRL